MALKSRHVPVHFAAVHWPDVAGAPVVAARPDRAPLKADAIMLLGLLKFLLASALAVFTLAGVLSLWGGWGLAVAAALALMWALPRR